jgi:hypothetical protein
MDQPLAGGMPGVASPIVIDGKKEVSTRPSPALDEAPGGESTD